MSLYILDSDSFQLFQERHPRVVARVQLVQPADLAITVITVEEQLSGWYAQLRQAKRPERLAWAYRRLAATARSHGQVQILHFDEPARIQFGTWSDRVPPPNARRIVPR
jgi:tRNA(fMet)-specific endonuclease VapC